MAKFADDTATLSSDPDPVCETEKLQHRLNLLQTWLEQWRIKVNPTKPTQVTFTTRRDISPPVNLHNTYKPVKKEVKYLRPPRRKPKVEDAHKSQRMPTGT